MNHQHIAIVPGATRRALNRRPTAADRIRAALARAALALATAISPRPSFPAVTDIWHG